MHLYSSSTCHSAFWEQQPLAARDYALRTIIPACKAVVELSTTAKDLIERELSAFSQSLDNNLYMLPATPQALLEALGSNGATRVEATSAQEAVSTGVVETDSMSVISGGRASGTEPAVRQYEIPGQDRIVLVNASWDRTQRAGIGIVEYNENGNLMEISHRCTQAADVFHSESLAILEALQGAARNQYQRHFIW